MPERASGDLPGFDAVVLAGGRGRRLGGASKPDVVVAGRRLLDHALAATAGARDVVVVGPAEVAPPGVRVTREDPPGGGPAAGLAAGLAALPAGAPLVLVLACDLPRVADAVPALLAAARGGDAAVLVDADGRRQTLAAVYRRDALDAALARVDAERGLAGAPMRAVVDGLAVVPVLDPAGLGEDVDTWADVERADVRAATVAAVAEELRAAQAARAATGGTPDALGGAPGGDDGRTR